jgi:hypothetical protein
MPLVVKVTCVPKVFARNGQNLKRPNSVSSLKVKKGQKRLKEEEKDVNLYVDFFADRVTISYLPLYFIWEI